MSIESKVEIAKYSKRNGRLGRSQWQTKATECIDDRHESVSGTFLGYVPAHFCEIDCRPMDFAQLLEGSMRHERDGHSPCRTR